MTEVSSVLEHGRAVSYRRDYSRIYYKHHNVSIIILALVLGAAEYFINFTLRGFFGIKKGRESKGNK